MNYVFILCALFFAFFFIGLYNLFVHLGKVPPYGKLKALYLAAREAKGDTGKIETYINLLADDLAKLLPAGEERRRENKERDLRLIGEPVSYNVFIARIILKSAIVLIPGIAALFLLPILAPVFVAICIFYAQSEYRRPAKLLTEKRNAIEDELPRFCLTIAQRLKRDRDVLNLFRDYRKTSGDHLRRELDITISDMGSGSIEIALERLDRRVGSGMLSDIVRGLLGVVRGDNDIIYFEFLSHDFKAIEISRLKTEVGKRPGKVKKYSFLLLGCVFLLYMVVLVYALLGALSSVM
jgi:hypothetical protein